MIPKNPIPPVWICQREYPPAISALLLLCWSYLPPHSGHKQGHRSTSPLAAGAEWTAEISYKTTNGCL